MRGWPHASMSLLACGLQELPDYCSQIEPEEAILRPRRINQLLASKYAMIKLPYDRNSLEYDKSTIES